MGYASKKKKVQPKGTGYSMDVPILEKVADARIRNPSRSLRAAIIAAGRENEPDICRISRKFRNNSVRLLQEAKQRANLHKPEYMEPSNRQASLLSFPYGIEVASWTKHASLIERFVNPISTMPPAIARIVDNLNRQRLIYGKLFSDIHKVSLVSDEMMKVIGALRNDLCLPNYLQGHYALISQLFGLRQLRFHRLDRCDAVGIPSRRTESDGANVRDF